MSPKLTRSDATAQARRLKQHLKSVHGLDIKHSQALDALAGLLGWRNRHELQASYAPGSAAGAQETRGTPSSQPGDELPPAGPTPQDDPDARFWKTVIHVEVLSERAPIEYDSLADVAYAITDGECSGSVETAAVIPLSGPQAAAALIAQGSDPEFFRLTDAGEPLDGGGDDDDGAEAGDLPVIFEKPHELKRFLVWAEGTLDMTDAGRGAPTLGDAAREIQTLSDADILRISESPDPADRVRRRFASGIQDLIRSSSEDTTIRRAQKRVL